MPNKSKQYHKTRPGQARRSSSDSHSQKTPIIQRYTNTISLVRQFIFELGLIGLVILGFALFFKGVLRTEIIIDSIEVPEDIAKLGYTGIVVAEKLADAALNIELETRELSDRNSWLKLDDILKGIGTSANIPDITVPGAQYSMRSITRFIRQVFNSDSIYLRGEIVHENDGLVLTLRKLSDAKAPAVYVSKKRIEQLFQEGGIAVLKLTALSTAAIYAYKKFSDQEVDYDQTVQTFEYCLKYLPKTEKSLVHTLWGVALSKENQPDKAIEQYHKAIKYDPKYLPAYNGLGNALLDRNRPEDHEEAFKQYCAAIHLDPKSSVAYSNLGNVLIVFKRPEEAIVQYNKAIDFDDKFADAYHNLGEALRDLKRPEEAIVQYRKAIDNDPNSPDAYNGLGFALLDLKRPPEAVKAIEQFNKAIYYDPKYFYAYNGLGNALLGLNRPNEAIVQYRKAIDNDIHAKSADAYTNWGNALLALKRPEKAVEKFRKAIDTDDKSVDAYKGWGNALLALKRSEKAKEKFSKAQELSLPKPFKPCL